MPLLLMLSMVPPVSPCPEQSLLSVYSSVLSSAFLLQSVLSSVLPLVLRLQSVLSSVLPLVLRLQLVLSSVLLTVILPDRMHFLSPRVLDRY